MGTKYRVVKSGTVGEGDHGREITLSSGDLVDSDLYEKDLLKYLLGRGFLEDINVEQATARPGERRATKRTPKNKSGSIDKRSAPHDAPAKATGPLPAPGQEPEPA